MEAFLHTSIQAWIELGWRHFSIPPSKDRSMKKCLHPSLDKACMEAFFPSSIQPWIELGWRHSSLPPNLDEGKKKYLHPGTNEGISSCLHPILDGDIWMECLHPRTMKAVLYPLHGAFLHASKDGTMKNYLHPSMEIGWRHFFISPSTG